VLELGRWGREGGKGARAGGAGDRAGGVGARVGGAGVARSTCLRPACVREEEDIQRG
jgi:hypothetical protein